VDSEHSISVYRDLSLPQGTEINIERHSRQLYCVRLRECLSFSMTDYLYSFRETDFSSIKLSVFLFNSPI